MQFAMNERLSPCYVYPKGYTYNMIELREYSTEVGKSPYSEWVASLDRSVAIRVTARLGRIQNGNFGDAKPIGDGVFELRFDFGPGYRVVILLCGGDKSTQSKDIEKAKILWSEHNQT